LTKVHNTYGTTTNCIIEQSSQAYVTTTISFKATLHPLPILSNKVHHPKSNTTCNKVYKFKEEENATQYGGFQQKASNSTNNSLKLQENASIHLKKQNP
jgi:hypothetical protein